MPTPLAYHITWGTYGTRLHGDPRGTVDRQHNQHGDPILPYDQHRWETEESNLKFPPVRLTQDQMLFIESTIPDICQRGRWTHRASAAGPDHVHVILTATQNPDAIRTLIKRWLGQDLSHRFPSTPRRTWWSECGSIRHIDNIRYYETAIAYVERQTATLIHKHSKLVPMRRLTNTKNVT